MTRLTSASRSIINGSLPRSSGGGAPVEASRAAAAARVPAGVMAGRRKSSNRG